MGKEFNIVVREDGGPARRTEVEDDDAGGLR